MTRSYAAFTTLIRSILQQSAAAGTAFITAAEMDYAIEDGLKEFSFYRPHIVPVVFKIESRYGTASTVSANNLVDTTKGQFTSTDATNEKVAHNTTDNTWAVISSTTSTAQVGLTADIFAANENYRIYNKQCWNNRQIYIGGVPENYRIESVEYPVGSKRNIQRYGDVVEIDVDYVEDSNAGSTVTQLPNVDVLVRFAKPHILTQLTDTAGKMAATAAAAATTISATSLQTAGTIKVGEEFTIQNHRSTYIVAASATIASNTTAITFYPPLESAVSSTTWVITFRESSLAPQDEELFANLVAARLSINKTQKYINTIVTGAGDVPGQYFAWGDGKLAETLMRLSRDTPPRTKTRYPSE